METIKIFLFQFFILFVFSCSNHSTEHTLEIDSKWERILVLHSEFFSAEVMIILNTAYVAKFGDLLPENFNPQDAE